MEITVRGGADPVDCLARCPRYPRESSALAKWLRGLGRTLDTDSVDEYLRSLKERGYAPRSYNLKLTAVKEGMRWLFANSPASMDMAVKMRLEAYLDTLKPYKIQSIAVSEDRVLTREEIDLLKEGVTPRLRLVIAFLYHTGLRVSEMASIKVADIRRGVDADFIQVLGKGNKIREIRCRRDLMDAIGTEFNGSVFLFESEPWRQGNEGGKPLSRHNITKAIKKAGARILGREISAHTFRHSFATQLIGEGKSIKAVSGYLGHSSVKTTLDLYVHDSLDLEDLPV